jgi:hypothetical protein
MSHVFQGFSEMDLSLTVGQVCLIFCSILVLVPHNDLLEKSNFTGWHILGKIHVKVMPVMTCVEIQVIK